MNNLNKEKNKTIWFFCTSEPNQLDGNDVKYRRHGQLINHLLKKNYNIILWTSTFSHFTKKVRTNLNKTQIINFEDNLKIFALKTLPYNKNISFKRYLSYFLLSREIKKNLNKFGKPDLIITSIPPVEPAIEFIKFAKKNNIPSICDFRDMWPDIILDNFNLFMKFAFFPFYILMNKQLKYMRNNSKFILAVSKGMLSWILNKSKKSVKNDYIYISHQIEPSETKKYHNKIKIFYAGVVGTANVMEKFLKFFDKLDPNIKNKFEINIAGYGDKYDLISKETKIENVNFLGWLNQSEIKNLSLNSNYGLVTYKNRIDFLNNVPNKISEYLGYGLPIITTLKGESFDLMKQKNCVYFSDIDNFENFKETMNLIITEKNYANLQKNARELFEQKFNNNNNLKKYEDIINEII